MSTNEGSSSETNPRKPACDVCRARKIRCDKSSPCGNCIASGVDCTLANLKPREKRTRILLTPQYEKKIDNIDQRLDDVLRLLGAVDLKVSSIDSPTARSLPGTSEYRNNSEPENGITVRHAAEESDSTLAVHAEMASEFAEDAAAHDVSATGVRQGLDALRDAMKGLTRSTTESESIFPRSAVLQHQLGKVLQLPPIEEVVTLLRSRKLNSDQYPYLVFEFLSTQEYSDICLGVYFSQDSTAADFVILNAGLTSLIEEASEGGSTHFADLCRANLETALTNLPLYLSPTMRTLIALLCGVHYSLSISKPLLAWTLSAKAAEICQSLGYHRLSPDEDTGESMKKEDTAKKLRLFWCFYIVDKFLSLRLRRAAALPDWDVTSSPPPFLQQPAVNPGLSNFSLGLMVPIARLHGLVYDNLFSSGAANQPHEETHLAIQKVVAGLEEYGRHLTAWNSDHNNGNSATTDRIVFSCDIMRSSLLVLAQRRWAGLSKSQDDEFTAAETAKRTLRSLQDFAALRSNKDLEELFPSILLYAPISFIALFCHVVQHGDKAGMQCLEEFTGSIHATHGRNPAMRKMSHLFRILSNLARCLAHATATTEIVEPSVDLFREADLVDPLLWMDDMSVLGDWVHDGLSAT